MTIVGYFFRTARFEYVRSVEAEETVVIFVHGILSETRNAFKLHNREGHFWDEIKDSPIFANSDIAIFSYGRTDFSYLLEGENPFNNLQRICEELNGYVRQYPRIIFVAHSQGGLLAKTYASMYYANQGIFLITLHTPHRNKSFSVMRAPLDIVWEEHARYSVPHVFCGSVNDNKIVKPSNALASGIDVEYISTDASKRSLGHSHLSSSPDPELIDLIENGTFHFLNSGLSGKFVDPSQSLLGSVLPVARICIAFSRSGRRLDDFVTPASRFAAIPSPWRHPLFLAARSSMSATIGPHSAIRRVPTVTAQGCSANYLIRCVLSKSAPNSLSVSIKDLDKTGTGSYRYTNDYLCERGFNESYTSDNPYSALPFDVRDFDSKALIDDKEFLDLFVDILKRNGLTLKKQIETYEKTYKQRLNAYYSEAVKMYRQAIVENVYRGFPGDWRIGLSGFGAMLSDIVRKIAVLPEKRQEYAPVFAEIRRITSQTKQRFTTYETEYLMSRILRSDGHLYWLDKHIRYIFWSTKSISRRHRRVR